MTANASVEWQCRPRLVAPAEPRISLTIAEMSGVLNSSFTATALSGVHRVVAEVTCGGEFVKGRRKLGSKR